MFGISFNFLSANAFSLDKAKTQISSGTGLNETFKPKINQSVEKPDVEFVKGAKGKKYIYKKSLDEKAKGRTSLGAN